MPPAAGWALGAALLCAPMAAHAQPLVSSWTAPEMKALVGAMGLTVAQDSRLDNGDPLLLVQSGATSFVIHGAACQGTGPMVRCKGASLVAFVSYETPAKAQAARARLDYPAVSITQDDPRTLGLTRYIVLDEGVHRKNLEANVRLFLAILEEALALR